MTITGCRAKPLHQKLQNRRRRGKGTFQGAVFQDTDVAKWLEAAAFTLASGGRDEMLESLADETIKLIGKAQCPDGYLNTYYTIQEPDRRWSNLKEGHELYTAGHMIEAAVAYYEATGKDAFLKIVSGLRMLSVKSSVRMRDSATAIRDIRRWNWRW